MAFNDALLDIIASFYMDVKIPHRAEATRDADGNLGGRELTQWGRELSCWMRVRRADSLPLQRYMMSKGSSAFLAGMAQYLAIELARLSAENRRVTPIVRATDPEIVSDDGVDDIFDHA